MPRIKKDELDKVMNSLYKTKERVLPANQKKSINNDSPTTKVSSKKAVYLIDGYNLMHSIEKISKIAEKDLLSARDKIINIVCDYQGYSGVQCILVFDAYKYNGPIPEINKNYNIVIVYTKAGQSADMYIEQKSKELNENYKVYVVTSDSLEQLRILSNNSLRISCREFMNRYNNYKETNNKNNKKTRVQPMKELRKLLFED